MIQYYFERALFIVGEPNAGKSKQLRSIFLDKRLGTNGKIPAGNKLPELYPLSNERCLYLRLTSPHEMKEAIDKFLNKTAAKMTSNKLRHRRRWNFACPLQPVAANRMPDVVRTCRAFVRHFNAERTRVVFLNPDRHGTFLPEAAYMRWVDRLLNIPSVEVCSIDARDPTANGVFLADFFDFI